MTELDGVKWSVVCVPLGMIRHESRYISNMSSLATAPYGAELHDSNVS